MKRFHLYRSSSTHKWIVIDRKYGHIKVFNYWYTAMRRIADMHPRKAQAVSDATGYAEGIKQ